MCTATNMINNFVITRNTNAYRQSKKANSYMTKRFLEFLK